MSTQNETVQKIAAVLTDHYAVYDSMSQDDAWSCNCNRSTYGGQPYRTRQQADQHVARRIEMALSERKIVPSTNLT